MALVEPVAIWQVWEAQSQFIWITKQSWNLLTHEFAAYLKEVCIYKQNFVFVFPSHKRDLVGDVGG